MDSGAKIINMPVTVHRGSVQQDDGSFALIAKVPMAMWRHITGTKSPENAVLALEVAGVNVNYKVFMVDTDESDASFVLAMRPAETVH